MSNNNKVKKLVDLVTADGFVSVMSIDPYKEEKQYTWLKEVQEYLNNKHNLDIDLSHNAISDKYLGLVFTKGGALIGDLYEPEMYFEYKEDALFYILTATLEYLNSPDRCARCDSHHTHTIRYGDNHEAYHCQECGAITVENEMIGEIGIEPVRTQSTIDTLRGYVDRYSEPMTEGQRLYAEIAREQDTNNGYVTGFDPIAPESTVQSISVPAGQRIDVQPISEMPANDLGTNLRWQTSEDFFSEQMSELNRVTPFDEAEDGSTQYSTGSTRRSRRYSNRLQERPLEPNDAYARPSVNLTTDLSHLEDAEQTLNNRPDISDYREVQLVNGSTGRIRTHAVPEPLRAQLDSDRYRRAVEDAQAELDRLRDEVSISRSNLRPHQSDIMDAMRELSRDTGMLPISGSINPNDEF